jgi:iron complex outermembrane receptor protein
MRLNPIKNKLCTAVAMATSLLAADIALAQSAVLEEVVVTARKRSEDLQDVPMAVSAFSSEELQTFSIDEITEVGRMTPNLIMNETSGLVGGAISVFMRGIGNDQGLEQGVGMYVDDVYLNRTSGSILEVFDVERIEVLKGPQGHLYGRNTIGGAIKYITREPGDELEGNFEVKAGSDEYFRIKGRTSGPLVDNTLYGDIAFSYKERDGYQDNSFAGSDDPWDAETGAVRGTLMWTPTDTLKIKLAADYSKDSSLPPIPGRIALDEGALIGINAVTTTANLLFGPGTAVLDTPNDTSFPNDEDDVSSGFVDGYDEYEIEQFNVAATVLWDLSDQWQLKSVTALRHMENTQPFDFDGSEQVWINTLRKNLESDDNSQELQLNFSGESIQAVMGLYYLDGDRSVDNDTTLQTVRLRAVQFNEKTYTRDDRPNKSYSAYGNVDWDFAENWQLSLGGRYTRDEKDIDQKASVTQGFYALALTPVIPGLPLAIKPGQEEIVEASPLFGGWLNPRYLEFTVPEDAKNDDDWDEFTPSARLRYDLNDDSMVYAGVSTGFKSGGFNNSGGNVTAYDPETVTTYSLGYKSTLLDNTLRLNTEFFYNDYKDKQLATIVLEGSDLTRLTSNVGKVTQWGGEFEMTWLTPLEGLLLNFNVGYLDSDVDEFKSFDNDGNKIDLADTTELGYSPEWTGQVRATYDFSLGRVGGLTASTDVSYQDDMYTNSPIDTTNPIKTAQQADAYYLWNASLAWRSNDEAWRVAVEGKNLNDEREIVNSFDIGIVASAGYNPPRTWAVSVGYSF